MKWTGSSERQDDSLAAVAISRESAARQSRERRGADSPSSKRRRVGIGVGLCLANAALCALFAPGLEHFTAPGKMNTGHEQLDCSSCHRSAPGTMRQQIQAGTRFVLGLRETPVDFGFRKVENSDCYACHERPLDRHPAFRFNEPRFFEARQAIAPQRCASCHREHSGRRVTVDASYCQHCHGDLQMKDDPLDVPHATLVRESLWTSCLGCHDFHGNHVMKSPDHFADAISPLRIGRYFEGHASPYPAELKEPARQNRADVDR
ncbi:MAG: cytochrome c3 family protein [Polyangiaceae bacterium]